MVCTSLVVLHIPCLAANLLPTLDLASFQNKYLVLKENWKKENRDIEGRNRQLTR